MKANHFWAAVLTCLLGVGTVCAQSVTPEARALVATLLGRDATDQEAASPQTLWDAVERHDEIWPELAQALRDAGISDYSIFFDEETLTLFAVQKLSDTNTAGALPQLDIMKKWWDYMAPLMDVNPDNSPTCTDLPELFHLE